MKHLSFVLIIVLTTVRLFAAEPLIPQTWFNDWSNPPAQMRPLQIIHGGVVNYDTPEKMSYFKDKCGLGGIVCNVGPNNYLRNEDEWNRFVKAVKSATEIGLRIWIYDEDGYPSPEAGGVVLDGHPELECLALVYDAQNTDEPFAVRPAYEFTHASNNHAAARRYPNLLDLEATNRFLTVTHEQYRERLGNELFAKIEAFFTDEPSLNAVNIGQIPESVRKNVRVDDPLDPDLKPLPMVPWCNDLPQLYMEKYGNDLLPLRKSLFTGNTEADKTVRENFWQLVGRLNCDRYYDRIRQWCSFYASSFPTFDDPDLPLRIASSGHTLHEEPTYAHVPLDGNKLDVLMKMDVPGLDMLNSDPRAVFWGAWRAAAFPASAAHWKKQRLVMSEVSDFSQQMEGKGPVDLQTMQAACSWQAAWGVTEFTLYYSITGKDYEKVGRGEESHKKFCEFIGRLNSVLRKAVPVRNVELYYPINELQNEYVPMAEPLDLQKMSERTQTLVHDFERTGDLLMKKQIPFVITENLNAINLVSKPEDVNALLKMKMPRIEPQNEWIVLGRFERDGCDIFLLLNTDPKKVYEGKLSVPHEGENRIWTVLDPATGDIRRCETTKYGENEVVPVRLESNQTLLYVSDGTVK